MTPGGWTASAALLEAHPTYSLRADCIADRLSLYIGDVMLGEVLDSDFSSGRVGLAAAAAQGKQGLVVDFDNFILYQPD